MWRPLTAALIVFVWVVAPAYSQQQKSKPPAKPPEIEPRKPECAILLPERGERNDLAKLIRAEQFLRCERDGFPKHLAPPWKDSTEGTKKLSDACQYYAKLSATDYPQVGQQNLKLAAARCQVNVLDISLRVLVRDLGRQPK